MYRVSKNVDSFFGRKNTNTLPKIRNKNTYGRIKENCRPLYVTFWLHGIGFAGGKSNNCMMLIVSIVMAAVVDVTCFYDIAVDTFIMEHAYPSVSKSAYIAMIMHIFSQSLRLWLYRRRCHLDEVVHKVANTYKITSWNTLKFGSKIYLLLFINYAFLASIFYCEVCGVLKKTTKFPNTARVFFLGHIPAPYASYLYLSIIAIRIFCLNGLPALIGIYFYVLTYILKKTFEEFACIIAKTDTTEFDLLLKAHNKITDTITATNDFLHTPLLLSFAFTLISAFSGIFFVLFGDEINTYEMCVNLLTFVWCIMCCGMFCFSSSSVINAAINVKNIIYRLPGDSTNTKRVSLFLKIQGKAAEFTLLQSIVIDKSLLLESLGTLFTYGIMFATFNVSSKVTESN